jgi:hypothetical protein
MKRRGRRSKPRRFFVPRLCQEAASRTSRSNIATRRSSSASFFFLNSEAFFEHRNPMIHFGGDGGSKLILFVGGLPGSVGGETMREGTTKNEWCV